VVKIPQPTDDPNDPLVSSHGAKRFAAIMGLMTASRIGVFRANW